MSELHTASLSDLNAVADWIGSGSQARNWAGPRVAYPLNRKRLPEQIQWWQAFSFCLLRNGQVIGFGQIVPKQAGRLHLARLIVSPSQRGRGYGRILAASLVDQALARSPSVISLNVFPDNTAAVELYRCIGFVCAGHAAENMQSQADYMVYRA